MDARTTIRVDLSPKPGFCIKSSALQSAVCKVANNQPAKRDGVSPVISGTLSIPQGMKVFVNIAWDVNVPPPPEGSEEAIQKAMSGEEDFDEDALASGRGWFVPVIVSEPRSELDKAGKPSVVIDCIYNSSLKSRCTRDAAFRTFLIELGLQRIEAQHSLTLSRQISQPNIASKGKLLPRSALVPLALFPLSHAIRAEAEKNKKKLIEEVDATPHAVEPATKSAVADDPAKPKGILKKGSAAAAKPAAQHAPPNFEWSKEGERIKVTVRIPNLTAADVSSASLDVEARRIILDIPASCHLDVDLNMPDAQIMSVFGGTSSDNSALMLKRQRAFDVDNADAEFRVQEGVIDIFV